MFTTLPFWAGFFAGAVALVLFIVGGAAFLAWALRRQEEELDDE